MAKTRHSTAQDKDQRDNVLVSSKDIPKNVSEQDSSIPEWHPGNIEKNIEIYDQKQKSDKPLYSEPEFNFKTETNEFCSRVFTRLTTLDIEITWTVPLVHFATSWLLLDKSKILVSPFIPNLGGGYVALPLFYFRDVIPNTLF